MQLTAESIDGNKNVTLQGLVAGGSCRDNSDHIHFTLKLSLAHRL